MMNKLTAISLVVLMTLSMGSFAQTETTAAGSTTKQVETNFAIYKKKIKSSNEDLENEKKTSNPKFWLKRAELLNDIFRLHTQFIQRGSEKIQVIVNYPEPLDTKTWTDDEGNNFEEMKFDFVNITLKNGKVDKIEKTQILYEDPLPEMLRSLEKTQELDTEGKLDKKVKELYDALKLDLIDQGSNEYYEPDYKAAFKSFETVDLINQKPIMEGAMDTLVLFYTGMTASKAGYPEKAIEYYERTIAANYDEPQVYALLKQKYFEVGDTAKGVEVLEQGFKKYPDNQAVLIELINYYLIAGKGEAALDYLKIAQSDDPENLSFIFAEATLYDKMGDMDKAMETYQRCLDVDPNYFNAYYNMGVMYYNKAVEMNKEAEKIGTPKEYGEAKDAADEVFKQSLPFMEKANSINPDDCGTLETLKTLYYRLQMNDKYETVKTKIDADCATAAAEEEEPM